MSLSWCDIEYIINIKKIPCAALFAVTTHYPKDVLFDKFVTQEKILGVFPLYGLSFGSNVDHNPFILYVLQ